MNQRLDQGVAQAELLRVVKVVLPTRDSTMALAQSLANHQLGEASARTANGTILSRHRRWSHGLRKWLHSLREWPRNRQAADRRYRGLAEPLPTSTATDLLEVLSSKAPGAIRALVTKELRGARREDAFSQQGIAPTTDKEEMVAVEQKKRMITEEVTIAEGTPRRSEKVQDLIGAEEVIEAETEETGLMGRMRLAELSSLARFSCPLYRKLKLRRYGLESR